MSFESTRSGKASLMNAYIQESGAGAPRNPSFDRSVKSYQSRGVTFSDALTDASGHSNSDDAFPDHGYFYGIDDVADNCSVAEESQETHAHTFVPEGLQPPTVSPGSVSEGLINARPSTIMMMSWLTDEVTGFEEAVAGLPEGGSRLCIPDCMAAHELARPRRWGRRSWVSLMGFREFSHMKSSLEGSQRMEAELTEMSGSIRRVLSGGDGDALLALHRHGAPPVDIMSRWILVRLQVPTGDVGDITVGGVKLSPEMLRTAVCVVVQALPADRVLDATLQWKMKLQHQRERLCFQSSRYPMLLFSGGGVCIYQNPKAKLVHTDLITQRADVWNMRLPEVNGHSSGVDVSDVPTVEEARTEMAAMYRALQDVCEKGGWDTVEVWSHTMMPEDFTPERPPTSNDGYVSGPGSVAEEEPDQRAGPGTDHLQLITDVTTLEAGDMRAMSMGSGGSGRSGSRGPRRSDGSAIDNAVIMNPILKAQAMKRGGGGAVGLRTASRMGPDGGGGGLRLSRGKSVDLLVGGQNKWSNKGPAGPTAMVRISSYTRPVFGRTLDHFKNSGRHLTFTPGFGQVGRSFHAHLPEFLRDCAAAAPHVFFRSGAAAQAGIHSSLAVPILAQNEMDSSVRVKCVLTLYSVKILESPHHFEKISATLRMLAEHKAINEVVTSTPGRYRLVIPMAGGEVIRGKEFLDTRKSGEFRKSVDMRRSMSLSRANSMDNTSRKSMDVFTALSVEASRDSVPILQGDGMGLDEAGTFRNQLLDDIFDGDVETYKQMTKALSAGSTWTGDLEMMDHSKGEKVFMRVTVALVRDALTGRTSIAVSGQDVTTETRALDDLYEKNQEIEALKKRIAFQTQRLDAMMQGGGAGGAGVRTKAGSLGSVTRDSLGSASPCQTPRTTQIALPADPFAAFSAATPPEAPRTPIPADPFARL
eukprot:CAMPEP_0182894832 /NCGR_PEP_ID=MMETSP0034_2-20130328/25311_1 /TAXON_ID=156128 /ORGANISM="Nephroselmis pyriformis, Strain CCMP717" /LENGTH=926 /DNA_ID=CAMNT_0025028635 /DNA_START=127 /DNA_END=2903 /DNA_ORIENTATION=-